MWHCGNKIPTWNEFQFWWCLTNLRWTFGCLWKSINVDLPYYTTRKMKFLPNLSLHFTNHLIRATFHCGQGPWQFNCEGPWNSSNSSAGRTMENWNWNFYGHGLSKSIVNTYATGLSSKWFSLPFYSCGPFYTIYYKQTRAVMRFWSVMVFSVLY